MMELSVPTLTSVKTEFFSTRVLINPSKYSPGLRFKSQFKKLTESKVAVPPEFRLIMTKNSRELPVPLTLMCVRFLIDTESDSSSLIVFKLKLSQF